MENINWDMVRDALIDEFCNEYCPDATQDYHCPNHNCPVWRTFKFGESESLKDDYPKFNND